MFFLILVLLVGILVPAYLYADRLFIQNELAHYQAQLENGCSSLAQMIKGINDALTFMKDSVTFLPLRYQKADEVDIIKLQEQQAILSSLYMQQPSVLEAGLVFSEDLALTSNRIYYPGNSSQFYPVMLCCESLPFEEWFSLLQARGNSFLPEMRYSLINAHSVNAVTYTARWREDASLYVLIASDSILKMFTSSEQTGELALEITDAYGTVIYTSREELIADCPYVLSGHVHQAGLEVRLCLPSATISRSISQLRQRVLLYLLIASAVLLLVIFLYALFFATRPLHELSQKIPAEVKNPSWFSVQETYRLLSDGISSMNQTISHQQLQMGKHLLDIALTRGYLSEEQSTTFRKLFPDFPESYRLVLFRMPPSLTEEQLRFAAELLQTTFPDCIMQQVDLNGVLLILNSEKYHRQDAATVREKLSRAFETEVPASSSDRAQSFEKLHDVWQEIILIESCTRNEAASHLMTSGDFMDKRLPLPLSIQDLVTFYSAVNTANAALANSILSNCTEQLMEQENNIPLYRHVYELIYRILRQLQMENPLSLAGLHLPGFSADNRVELFASVLPSCVNEYCGALAKKRGEKNDTPDILSYLEDNLSSPDLCVDSAASHFGISSTTLQKLCQEAAGMTVAAYIENRRMSRSYAMLAQGNLTIAEIARLCGYNSSNSFYKAFKRHFSIAPRDVTSSAEEKRQQSDMGTV